MRYARIDTISFTDINGNNFPIKDIRPLETGTLKATIRITEKDRLDEVASRIDVYGREGYRNAYKLFDANATILVENCIDIGKLRLCKVPV
jgi:phage gp36-like protein